MRFLKTHTTFILFSLLCVSVLLRFYNLTWGAPFYFHPDERNIASSITQLVFPSNFHPHFFAYGSFPIYVIFLSGILFNFFYSIFTHSPFVAQVSFEQAIFIGRFYSAFFSLLLIPLLYYLGKKLYSEVAGLFAAALATFCTGFIQFAHFGTFEMWLSIFTVLLFTFCLKLRRQSLLVGVLSIGVITGILVAIKVSSLVLFPLPIIAIFLILFFGGDKFHITKRGVVRFFTYTFIFFLSISIIYILSNPFVFLDFSSFKGSMEYESGVALGTIPVFYTGEFVDSIPVLFQTQNVLPFLLNPVLTLFFIPAFFLFVYKLIKTREISFLYLLLFFLVTFFSQAFLYVKWVRYLVPSLPFMLLILSVTPFFLFEYVKKIRFTISFLLIPLLLFSSILFSVSYFITVFVEKDSRILAFEYAKNSISPSASILSEVYDLGIIPYNQTYGNITLFNFYDLSSSSPEYNEETLASTLAENEYIILPSQRIFKTRISQPVKYPLASSFYQRLFLGELGYEKIYETTCSVWCQITYLTDPVYSYEQTASVFDRPHVTLFKKQ